MTILMTYKNIYFFIRRKYNIIIYSININRHSRSRQLTVEPSEMDVQSYTDQLRKQARLPSHFVYLMSCILKLLFG